jgi:hypothetical protein
LRTPAYTSPKPPEAILCAIKYRARSGSTIALIKRINLDINKKKRDSLNTYKNLFFLLMLSLLVVFDDELNLLFVKELKQVYSL